MPRAGGQVRLPSGSRGGQAILEYVLVFAVVAAAILGIQVLAKRGIQETLKVAADDLSSVLPPSEAPYEQGLPPEELAQLNGMRYESGADTRDRRGELRAVPGLVIARESTFTTTDDSAIRAGPTDGGGFMTENVAVSTVATGTASSQVLGEVQQ